MAKEFRDDRVCFVCGEKNPIGLKLRIRTDPERGESSADVVFREDFQGWAGIVHGGFLATVPEESLIYAAGAKGLICVTGEITVRFIKPASTDVPYTLKGPFVEDKGRIVIAESVLLDSAGEQEAPVVRRPDRTGHAQPVVHADRQRRLPADRRQQNLRRERLVVRRHDPDPR